MLTPNDNRYFFALYKTCSLCESSKTQKGGMDMEDAEFRELFQRIVDAYALEPDLAEELLQRILRILARRDSTDEYS